jgi:ligand-binding sensor domain-containing protein
VYLAGSDGLVAIERNTGRMQRLSSERAGSVAAAGQHVYAGSARSSALLHIAPTGERSTVGPAGNRVRVLNDRVWVAARQGLFHAPAAVHPDSTRFVLEPGLPVASYVDVAIVGDRLAALTADALFVRDSSGWRSPIRLPAMRGLGRLTTLAADGSALWVGGVNGLARYQPATGEWLYFLAPRDLPAGPIEILPQGAQVWLATPAGALRINWRP